MTKRLPRRPGLLSTDEVARALGVCVDTVTRWWSEGLLPEVEPPSGRRPRMFDRDAVEKVRHPAKNGHRYRGLDLTGVADDTLCARFWSKVDKNGPVPAHRPELGNCWVWTRYATPAGYGQFVVGTGHFRLAHMVSYALANGPIAPGAYICHHCDNPPCVRTDHLFLGTPQDNALDMFAKGRQGSRHPGTERANARLTEADIIAIRAVPRYFGRTSALARQYGVSSTTIRKIVTGQKWRHVA